MSDLMSGVDAGSALDGDGRRRRRRSPNHLVALPGGDWALWRWAGLRGTGFPFEMLLELAEPECAAAADRVLQAETRVEELWRIAQAAISDELKIGEPEFRVELSRAQKLLRKGKAPRPLPPACRAATPAAEFAGATEELDRAYLQFQRCYEQAALNASQAIKRITGMKNFCEAVIWQNRQAFHLALTRLQEEVSAGERNKRDRQSEELIVSYCQRYCAKNDTIGFFGPVGWARLDTNGEAFKAAPGPGLISERRVYFSDWCIDALAEALSKNPELRSWMIPHPASTHVRIDGQTLRLPLGRTISLTATEAAVLRACDGRRSARQIAEELCAAADGNFWDEAGVYQALADCAEKDWVFWRPRIAMGSHPEQDLMRAFDSIDDAAVRNHALAVFDELEEGRREIERAAGDPERLDAALGDVEKSFTRLTGASPTRAEGRMYASRTLVYEDCRRDLDASLGRPVLEALGPPLSLLLHTARWFTHQVAVSYAETFHEVHARLAHELGPEEVDAFSFWAKLQSIFYGDRQDQSVALRKIMIERWAEILEIPPGVSAVHYRSDQIGPRVRAAFDSPGPGWKGARYHSPDLMIAASSAEAIRAGDFQLILGEVHMASNTLNYAFFLSQHPSPEELRQAVATDLPEPRVILTPPKSWARRTARTHAVIAGPNDFCLEYAADSPGLPGVRALPIASLVIRERDEGLTLETRDGRTRFGLLDALAEALVSQVIDSFKILVPGSHAPRVTIDKLAASRETWRFPAGELDFAGEKDESLRYLAARRWAQENGLPRFVFYKSPVEVKPCYLDFESPSLVNLMAKVVRRTQRQPSVGGEPVSEVITITEMLPTPDQLWLVDADRRRYTSEFRLVAVDLSEYPSLRNI